MIELTDEDRAILGPMLDHGPEGNPIRGLICGQATEVYLAGLRAGLERAAKVCDTLEHEWYETASESKHIERAVGSAECAKSIRALLDKD